MGRSAPVQEPARRDSKADFRAQVEGGDLPTSGVSPVAGIVDSTPRYVLRPVDQNSDEMGALVQEWLPNVGPME